MEQSPQQLTEHWSTIRDAAGDISGEYQHARRALGLT